MRWKKLLAALVAQGLTVENPDLVAVKAFLADKNIDVAGDDGKALDLDAMYAARDDADNAGDAKTKTRLVLSSDALSRQDLDDIKDARAKRAAAARGTGYADAHVDDDADARKPQPFFIDNGERKQFNARANRGETCIPDADTAEFIGAFMRYAGLKNIDYQEKKRDAEIIGKANVSYSFASGGFATPDIVRNTLINVRSKYEAVAEMVDIIPIEAAGESVPRRSTGITVYSPGEGVAATESNPTGDQVKLSPFEMVGLCTVSKAQFMKSQINFGDWIANELRYAISKKLEEIVFLGDGSSTYFNQQGLLGKFTKLTTDAGGTWSTNAEYCAGMQRGAGNLWSELTFPDITALLGKVGLLETVGPIKIACSWPFVQQVLVPLAMSKGGVSGLEVANGIPRSWQGYPIVMSNALPQVEANGSVCAYAGDFAQGMKVGVVPGSLELSTSDQAYWSTRKIGYQMAVHHAVTVHDAGNASSTAASRVAGPIAALITAES